MQDTYQGESVEIVLCHYPLATWRKAHWGSWHIYGHSTAIRVPSPPTWPPGATPLNAWCSLSGWMPVPFAELVRNNGKSAANEPLSGEERQTAVELYTEIPYRMTLDPFSDSRGWVVSFPNLPGCQAQGATPEEALQNAPEAKRQWMFAALADGRKIKEPLQ